MTKAEEIKILSAAAKKLGNDSYLGDALKSLIPYIESEIRSDIYPNLLGLVMEMEAKAATLSANVAELKLTEKALDTALTDRRKAIERAENRRDEIEEEIERAKWKAVDALNVLKNAVPDALIGLACK